MSCIIKSQIDKTVFVHKNPIFLIAEIGGNHEGDFSAAKRLTQLAIDSGVDAIKYQVYSAKSLVNPAQSIDRFNHFRKFELLRYQHIWLAKLCIRNDVKYIASAWDTSAIKWLNDYIDIYKIGSGDITAYPIIKLIAEKGKPIILSTGMATTREIDSAIRHISLINPDYLKSNKLAVLQCTSSYPTCDKEANLGVLSALKRRKGVTIGYSDHTEGTLALEMAATLGARILEFHFTDSRKGKKFRDHKISLTKNEVIKLRNKISKIRNLLGDGKKRVMVSEIDNRRTFRRAVYPIVYLPKGSVITEKKLVYLRPNNGIDAKDYKKIIGKVTTQNVHKYQRLSDKLWK